MAQLKVSIWEASFGVLGAHDASSKAAKSGIKKRFINCCFSVLFSSSLEYYYYGVEKNFHVGCERHVVEVEQVVA